LIIRRLNVDYPERSFAWHNPDSTETLVPGLVDIHCHGVAGLDVMDGDAAQIGVELRQRGVEWYCPTTVTASISQIQAALTGLAGGFPGFAGVHLEGPFVNPEKAGAQPPEHIVHPLDVDLEAELGQLMGLVRIVTLAPEMPGAHPFVQRLSARGVLCSIGHSNAKASEVGAAFNSGARNFTHFFNAMSPLSHREPGCVGFGLSHSSNCELIYDRVHVCREAAEILFRCRGNFEVIGISDGTKLSGTAEGTEAEMWGHAATHRDGCARLPDGTLAGSAVTLAEVFSNIWQDFGPEAAILACSENPRRLLGLPESEIWLRVDTEGKIVEVYKGNLSAIESGS
jgi:N-acetylglucosamine-6-phosphate deacetylase